MAQISFEQATKELNNNWKGPSVGFFSLRNDGDEALVRFMHDNTSTFDLVTFHTVKVDGKDRKVNCIRDPREPLDNCPFCKANIPIHNRFFIHLIQYDKDETGKVIPTAKIWERSLSYATQLATLINEYGPLSECLFKIKRNGAAGSTDTTYSIMYASPQVYRPELYPNVPNIFEGYKTVGTIVMDKNYEELVQFMNTGKFPEVVKTEPESASPTITPYPNTPAEIIPPVYTTSTTPVNNNRAPWEASPAVSRPVRTY